MKLTITTRKKTGIRQSTPELKIELKLDQDTAVTEVIEAGSFIQELQEKIKEKIDVKYYRLSYYEEKNKYRILNFYHGDWEKNASLGSIQFDTEAKTATISGFQLIHFKDKKNPANSQIETILRTTLQECEAKKNTTNNDAHIPRAVPVIDTDNSSTTREKKKTAWIIQIKQAPLAQILRKKIQRNIQNRERQQIQFPLIRKILRLIKIIIQQVHQPSLH